MFLLDYCSDLNCLVWLVVEEKYFVAVAQAIIFVLPFALDCYRGKVQIVEVIGSFARARRKGFPTNAYIQALRSEKGVEAPLSFCLQFYSLLQATSFQSTWSLCLSLPLSVLSMSKHIYCSFELNMLDVVPDVAEDTAQTNSSAQTFEGRSVSPPTRAPPDAFRITAIWFEAHCCAHRSLSRPVASCKILSMALPRLLSPNGLNARESAVNAFGESGDFGRGCTSGPPFSTGPVARSWCCSTHHCSQRESNSYVHV